MKKLLLGIMILGAFADVEVRRSQNNRFRREER